YYLLQRTAESPSELWTARLETGRNEAVLPGVAMNLYDISPDEKEVVFSSESPEHRSQLWLAPLDRLSPPRKIAADGEDYPRFGPHGEILFLFSEGGTNYLFKMNRDGSGRRKAVPYPISSVFGISPDRKWLAAIAPVRPEKAGVALMAIPV